MGIFALLLLLWSAPPADSVAAQDPLARAGKLYDAQDWEGAAALYKRAARKGTSAAIAWFNYGNCMVQLKKRGEAAAAWRKALEWAPRFKRAKLNLAILAEEDGDIATATVQYRALWEASPNDPVPALRLAEMQAVIHANADAAQWYSRALGADSSSTAAWQGLVRMQLEVGDTAQACEYLEQWSRRPEADSAAAFLICSLNERAGALGMARRACEQGLAAYPLYPQGWLQLARLQQLMGADATAVAVLRQGLKLLPDQSDLWIGLAQATLRAGLGDQSYLALLRARQLQASQVDRWARALADWHRNRGEEEFARRADSLQIGLP